MVWCFFFPLILSLATTPVHSSSAAATAALYYQTNDPVRNEIVAVGLHADTGLLTGKSRAYATGGKGAAGIVNVTSGAKATHDGLFAQSAVASGEDGVLLAVNAGSNTLSMFKINRNDPTKLTRVGKPVDTMGDFPLSVAYSMK